MHRRSIRWHFLSYFLIGCTTSTVPPSTQPAPSPALPSPISIPEAGGPWTFIYTPGPVSYKVSRSATIESQSDSGAHREISTNATYESLVLTEGGDTTHFMAVVDTFSTTTQGSIGVVQTVQLPIQLAGLFTADSLINTFDSATTRCNPVGSALATDIRNLLVRFPPQLTRGSSWRDSVELNGCQGNIPTTAHTTRSYLVLGETSYQRSAVLMVQRTDTILAHGEGAQQQHRVVLDASGSGTAIYYLNLTDGQIMHLTTGQELNLTITASGKINLFRQSSKQDFNLVR
jgi:hypothetical protein